MALEHDIVEAVRQEIGAVFSDGVLPENVVCHSCLECDEIGEAFRGKHWKDMGLEFLSRFRESLCLLSPEAFWFYLPAYMMVSLDHFDEADIIPESIIYNLTPPTREHANIYEMKHFLGRIEGFTEAQKKAIRSFIKFVRSRSPETFHDSENTTALMTFWKMNKE